MIDFGQRDPEEIGPEHPDDLDLRMRVVEARHEFEPGPNGRCAAIWGNKPCNLDSSSVMHIDYMLDMHDHGGGDCTCFENDY